MTQISAANTDCSAKFSAPVRLTVAAVLGATLAQTSIYSATLAAFLKNAATGQTWITLTFFILAAGMLAGVALLSKAMARLFGKTEENASPAWRRLAVLPVALILAAGISLRFPGHNPWAYTVARTFPGTVGFGIASAGMFMLFFSVVPPGRRGLWCGAGLGAGFAWWRLIQTRTYNLATIEEAQRWYNFIFTLQTLTLIAMTSILVYGLVKMTPREQDVARLFAEGKTPQEIARELYISEHTVKTHFRNIMGKIGVSSRNALLVRLLQKQ